MEDDRAKNLVRRGNKLFSSTERRNAESQWELITEFMLPSQSGKFLGESISGKVLPTGTSTPGAKKTTRLFDSTAIQANHDLASNIHSTLTNPATKWSKIRFASDELNNNDEAVRWLEEANDIIHTFISESNFDNEIARAYKQYTSIGNMALLHDEGGIAPDGQLEGFKFKAIHLAQIAWSENADGIVDTVYRKMRLTARQAVERWGNKVSDRIKEVMEKNPEQEFDFLHYIAPRNPKDVKLNDVGLAKGKDRPYASIYIDVKDNTIVEETGYYEFPVYAVRWETVPSEVYGRGPGDIALPDVRTLNRAKELGLHAINKAINPPMLAVQRGVLGPLDLRPGQVSVVRDTDAVRELVTQARFDVTQFAVEDLKNSVKSIFFLDKLMLPPRTEHGEMTAFEVQQRVLQMQKVLGPTLGRLNTELLSPMIIRSFKMLLRSGALPEIPEILRQQGILIDIEFINPLARTQRIEDVTALRQWMEGLAGVAQLGKPEVLDYVNSDFIAKHSGRILGVPEGAVTSDEVVQQTREQRAQQQAQQQALQAGVQAADIASKIPQE